MVKGVQAVLGPKFGDLLPALESAFGQTEKQREAVKSNITVMGLLIRTVKSVDLLVKIGSMMSEDWSSGRMDLAMVLLDKKFREGRDLEN